MSDVVFKCRCGQTRLSAPALKSAAKVLCFCKDCQAFANHLGAGDLLDEHGGTYIVQTSPKAVKITRGRENIKCLRLGPKGMLRWYAGCCDTPMANTLPNAGVPFIGFMTCNIDGGADVFGPVVAIANTKSASTPGGPDKDSGLATAMAKFAKRSAAARLSGSYKDTPFFTFPDRKPIVQPTVLSKEQRAAATPS